MRPRTRIALGIGATATVAATTLATGLAGPQHGPLHRALAPPAAAVELPSFAGCEELRRWYVDAALPHVTPWGLGGGFGPVAELARDQGFALADGAETAVGTDEAVGNGPTGTNVQEAGVDEPDLAKTDGTLLAHVAGRTVVLTDVTGDEPRRLASVRLPRGLGAGELLLVGDRLVVVGSAASGVWPVDAADAPRPFLPGPVADPLTRVLVVDVTAPAAPRVVHQASYSGSLVSTRLHDGVVRLVLSTASPALDFVVPRRGRTPAEALHENRQLVRESPVEAWLPTVETTGTSTPLVGCGDVRHPGRPSGYGTVTVVGLDPDDPAERRTAAVTTSSDLVYSSPDRLYLATTYRRGSAVHAFALDGLDTTYVASGRVPGTVRDRWSMSEHEGHLRVATALGPDPWSPDENAVVVLEERGERLVEVGRVAAMGIREQIRSVRWFGDVGVVVTFRQVDPLYTLDLSDPAAPKVLGELKIPGFSSYLHPLGDDLLLGLGQDADRRGTPRGAQASVFDVADLASPHQVDVQRFGASTEFVAAFDPRGLTYLPDRRTVLAVLEDWGRGSRVVVMTVATDGTLTRHDPVPVPGWEGFVARALPIQGDRVALIAEGKVSLVDLPARDV